MAGVLEAATREPAPAPKPEMPAYAAADFEKNLLASDLDEETLSQAYIFMPLTEEKDVEYQRAFQKAIGG